MDLENIMLSEMSQSEKDRYHIISQLINKIETHSKLSEGKGMGAGWDPFTGMVKELNK